MAAPPVEECAWFARMLLYQHMRAQGLAESPEAVEAAWNLTRKGQLVWLHRAADLLEVWDEIMDYVDAGEPPAFEIIAQLWPSSRGKTP